MLAPRTQEADTSFPDFDQVQILREWRVSNNAVGVKPKTLSRSLSAILPFGTDAPVVVPREEAVLLPSWEYINCVHEGSFVGDKRLLGQPALLGRSPPERDREAAMMAVASAVMAALFASMNSPEHRNDLWTPAMTIWRGPLRFWGVCGAAAPLRTPESCQMLLLSNKPREP